MVRTVLHIISILLSQALSETQALPCFPQPARKWPLTLASIAAGVQARGAPEPRCSPSERPSARPGVCSGSAPLRGGRCRGVRAVQGLWALWGGRTPLGPGAEVCGGAGRAPTSWSGPSAPGPLGGVLREKGAAVRCLEQVLPRHSQGPVSSHRGYPGEGRQGGGDMGPLGSLRPLPAFLSVSASEGSVLCVSEQRV